MTIPRRQLIQALGLAAPAAAIASNLSVAPTDQPVPAALPSPPSHTPSVHLHGRWDSLLDQIQTYPWPNHLKPAFLSFVNRAREFKAMVGDIEYFNLKLNCKLDPDGPSLPQLMVYYDALDPTQSATIVTRNLHLTPTHISVTVNHFVDLKLEASADKPETEFTPGMCTTTPGRQLWITATNFDNHQ